jgi:hypothetical protein
MRQRNEDNGIFAELVPSALRKAGKKELNCLLPHFLISSATNHHAGCVCKAEKMV